MISLARLLNQVLLLKSNHTMDCQTGYQQNLNNLLDLQHHLITNRVPASGSINLINRCNLSCVHCYLGSSDSKLRSSKAELKSDQWLSIIDQLTEAGCIYVLLTGGEPLLHPEFEIIYHKCVTNGLLVDVFTNGTLITEKTLSLFTNLPPQSVEISLYGATPQTYETITGVRDSFNKCLQGIEGLVRKQVNVKLKTMMLTWNRGEWEAMGKIAASFGVGFRMDPAISPCLDGNSSPLQYRVDPAEAIKADFANPERAASWVKYFKQTELDTEDVYLYGCGAGLTNFHIDPDGTLLPCMMLHEPAYDLTKGNFMDGWKNKIPALRSIKAGKDYQCNRCKLRGLCGSCPAFFELENGSPENHSEYLCSLAKYRLEEISRILSIKKKP